MNQREIQAEATMSQRASDLNVATTKGSDDIKPQIWSLKMLFILKMHLWCQVNMIEEVCVCVCVCVCPAADGPRLWE